MLFVMLASLYTVRVVLSALGETDYGIYNVVGGVVTMFSFLSGSLATSSQRYFSMEIAKQDYQALRKVFSLNITVFGLLALIVLVLAETVGLWFVNSKMTIPSDRIMAANVVYQLSIVSFVVNLISIPYHALIISYERMSAFAWIGIGEALSKLFIAYCITFTIGDKLIFYGILMLLLTSAITSSYYFYCFRNFKNCRYHYYWNKKEALLLLSFSGWHFLGTVSVVVRSQGINLLINTFFNPVVNAARAIAFQINSAVVQFSNNFFTAVKPQIYKSYSNGEMQALFKLINRSTIMTVCLVSLLVFPIFGNIDFILSVWLDEVPEHTVLFVQLVLINTLIDATSNSVIAPALATGNIKNFEIVTSLIYIFNLPVSYLALRMGAVPEFTTLVSIMISFVSVFVRAYFLKKMMDFPYWSYVSMIIKLTMVSIVLFVVVYYIPTILNLDTWNLLITSVIISTIFIVLSYYMFVLTKDDRNMIMGFVKSKIRNA